VSKFPNIFDLDLGFPQLLECTTELWTVHSKRPHFIDMASKAKEDIKDVSNESSEKKNPSATIFQVIIIFYEMT